MVEEEENRTRNQETKTALTVPSRSCTPLGLLVKGSDSSSVNKQLTQTDPAVPSGLCPMLLLLKRSPLDTPTREAAFLSEQTRWAGPGAQDWTIVNSWGAKKAGI